MHSNNAFKSHRSHYTKFSMSHLCPHTKYWRNDNFQNIKMYLSSVRYLKETYY